VLSASFDKSIKLWDGVKGTFIATFRNHVGPVFQVAWSSDSRLFVTGSKDSTLKVRLVAALVIAAGSGACERAMGSALPYQPYPHQLWDAAPTGFVCQATCLASAEDGSIIAWRGCREPLNPAHALHTIMWHMLQQVVANGPHCSNTEHVL